MRMRLASAVRQRVTQAEVRLPASSYHVRLCMYKTQVLLKREGLSATALKCCHIESACTVVLSRSKRLARILPDIAQQFTSSIQVSFH